MSKLCEVQFLFWLGVTCILKKPLSTSLGLRERRAISPLVRTQRRLIKQSSGERIKHKYQPGLWQYFWPRRWILLPQFMKIQNSLDHCIYRTMLVLVTASGPGPESIASYMRVVWRMSQPVLWPTSSSVRIQARRWSWPRMSCHISQGRS